MSHMNGIYNSAYLRCQGAWPTAKKDIGVVGEIEYSADAEMPGTGALLKTLLK